MEYYYSKVGKFPGTNYKEVYKKAWHYYLRIKTKSKRRPYIRSRYFRNEKIFLGLFWFHLRDKHGLADKVRRLKYFPCAIELLQKSKVAPSSKVNVDKKSEVLHRFAGSSPDGNIFFVQVKEDIRSEQKYLISVFGLEK